MAVYYVPNNNNSFWQQINNGTGLYGLVMSQLVKGLMNGVNKRHEAYIDKKAQDRQAAQDSAYINELNRLRGTEEATNYTPMKQMQFQGDTPQMRQALGQGIRNPLKQYGQNEFANTANEGLADVAKAWDNAEGYGKHTSTKLGNISPDIMLQAAMNTNMPLDRLQKLQWLYEQQIKNATDLADAQQRAQAVLAMREPQDTRDLSALGVISGKEAVSGYNAMHPQLKLDVRNAGNRADYSVFNPRTGEMKTTQGQPYGVSPTAVYNKTTIPASTIYTQGKIDARKTNGGGGKAVTDAQKRAAFNAGAAMRYKYANPDQLTAAVMNITNNPELQKAYFEGAFKTPLIFNKDRRRNEDDKIFYKKVPMRAMKIMNPNYGAKTTQTQSNPQPQTKTQGNWKQPTQLSANDQAWINYAKSKIDTTGMTTEEILALRKKK